ncbi:hypothetical protein LY76DRAFT_532079 [Colletotrichum caudatum]|nr:hypothetical protein LY76DRAFT_532079 [Colletotrichum caudatum]
MTLIEARLKKKDDEGRLQWNDATKYSWIGDLGIATAVQDPIKNMPALDTIIDPLPVVISLSPFVLSADHISLEDLAAGIYTVPANLPEACQTLHNNVAGAKITLDDDNFPEFSKAIQRSCTTNGLWAFEKLKSKATEFGGPNETYLRITLGYNLGDSPGVPYVLEIWPSQHYSPIHDHGNACAVIKVLHGEITCTWYDTLDSPRAQVGSGKLHKGAITWIGDENYQIHKLENHSSEVCCTIQCYRYDGQDNVHYDGFNWVDGHGSVEKFVPNSDMDFLDFKRLMREEWYSQTTNNRNGHV